MARKLGLRLYRTCVKENINVTEVGGALCLCACTVSLGDALGVLPQGKAVQGSCFCPVAGFVSAEVCREQPRPKVPCFYLANAPTSQYQRMHGTPLACVQVFVYLSEQHQRKLAAGQLGGSTEEQDGYGHQPQFEEPVANQNNRSFGVDEPQQEQARTVELGPSRKRTKGKKTIKDKLTSCSIL